MNQIWDLLKQTYQKWSSDDVTEYAAALAYFTIFSLAPLLIIAVAVAGLIFGRQEAQAHLIAQIQQAIGAEAANAAHQMIANTSHMGRSLTAIAIGLATLLLGAMRIFIELKKMLNKIWNVKVEQGGVRIFFERYLWSFLMVLGVGLLLLAMIIVSAALSYVTRFLGNELGSTAQLWQVANTITSFIIFTLLFAMIYKFLPERRIPWGDVWVGALVTSILFTAGRFLIGLYLGRATVASPYGAAGSLVILLIFIYYSALILFFGAEFTEVYARCYGSQKKLGGAAAGETTREAPRAMASAPSFGQAVSRGGLLLFSVATLTFLRKLFHHHDRT